jgi:phosphohistidine phosphatase SixA
MILAEVLLAASLALAPSTAPVLPADSAMTLLAKGGYTLLWRHAATDRSVADAPGFPNTERYQQRNLSDQGVADARMIGRILKSRDIPFGDVITSPMYRTRETALYALGRVTTTDNQLITIEPNADQKRLLLVVPAPGTNRVIVTHHFVIEQNVPGIKPGDVGEGEIAVVKSDGSALQLVSVIKMADWQRMNASSAPAAPGNAMPVHGGAGAAGPITPRDVGTLVIPPAIHTQKYLGAAIYLHSFNQGAAAMRSYFEQWVVPNPERTIDQRMATYESLQKELGKINIVSIDTSTANKLVVDFIASTGRDGKITFTIEPAAPNRVSAISIEFKRPG